MDFNVSQIRMTSEKVESGIDINKFPFDLSLFNFDYL